MNYVPFQIHVKVLTLSTSKYTYLERVIADLLKMRSYWVRVGPKSKDLRGTGLPTRTQVKTQGHREDHVILVAGTAVLCQQAKGCQQPPEARGRGMGQILPQASRKNQPC